MKQLPPFPTKYWLKFSEKTVELKPFNLKSTSVAKEYMKILFQLLSNIPKQSIFHYGSTNLGIIGKGEIEIGIQLNETNWYETVQLLINYYKHIGNLENNHARFNDNYKDFDIEVICMKSNEATITCKVYKYLKTHPSKLKEYIQLKKNFSYSKREYQKQKDNFFREIIQIL